MKLENKGLIAERIMREMKRKRVTQKELADKLGITQSQLSKVLNGKGYKLKEELIREICKILGVDYGEMIRIRSPYDNLELSQRIITTIILEQLGVEIDHVKTIDSVEYRANKSTNYKYWYGANKYLTEEETERMRKNCDDYEESYEVKYHRNKKILSKENYLDMIDSLYEGLENSLKYIFMF